MTKKKKGCGKYEIRRVLRDAGTGRFISKAVAARLPRNQWIEQRVRRLRSEG